MKIMVTWPWTNIFIDYDNNDHATDNADHQDGPDFIYLFIYDDDIFTILQRLVQNNSNRRCRCAVT